MVPCHHFSPYVAAHLMKLKPQIGSDLANVQMILLCELCRGSYWRQQAEIYEELKGVCSAGT
jgi:hypothetical protein